MDLVASCKDKLQYFRIKELKDVLTQLGLSKQGKKQDLVDRILAVLVDDQVHKMWAKRLAFGKEDIARLVDDTYRTHCKAPSSLLVVRKVQGCGATDLASKALGTSDTTTSTATTNTLKPKEEVINDDSFNQDMKVRCPCGNSLLTESMIRCEDPRCQVWQHISCVIIPEKPMDGIPPVPSQFYCVICRLIRADPFWSTVAHPLYPARLMATTVATDGTNPAQTVEKTFHLTRADRELLSKPEYAVQAWCMLLNDKVPFRMQWPQYSDLQVNGVPVRAISRPGSQLLGANGRDDGPNISQFTRDGINKIFLSGCDARIFCLGVRLVKRRPLTEILSMIPKEPDGELFEDALARVRRCIGGAGAADNADSDSDLEVVADSFTVNLRCPMSGSRMKTAGRFRPCAHMGCFDLETFVEMQQRSRKWQCPICLKNYSLEHIIIDPYFNRIAALMHSCGEDTTEIEVKPDGSWRVKGNSESREFRQWHLPDGSICSDEGLTTHTLEALKPIKQEGSGLKLEIRKNSNGEWEVNKHGDANALSSGERMPENFGNSSLKVLPMSCSATGSLKDGEDLCVNHGGSAKFDLAENNGFDLHPTSLDLEPTFGFTAQNVSAAAKDADVIVLSDSDEENDTIARGAVHSNGLIDDGVSYGFRHHEIQGSYQEPSLGIGRISCLDLFNPAEDEFGLPLWQLPSSSQAISGFQLFGSDGDGPDGFANTHLDSLNCPTSFNGCMLDPDGAMNSGGLVPDSSVGHSYNDLNDNLVDNPLAFGGEDPALQIFLPTRPSDISGHNDVRNNQDLANGLFNEDWISLRLGDSVGGSHGDSGAVNDMNTAEQIRSIGAVDSLADTASFLLESNGSKSEKTRERSDSPFSFPRQKRSVRQRLYLSIDSESE